MLVIAGELAGCRAYEPAPIDLDRIDRVFRDRAATIARTPSETDAVNDDAILLAPADAEATALLFNLDLRRRRAEAGVAEATAMHAGLWPDPVVGLELTRLLQSVGNPTELFGTVGLTLPISGRLEIEKQRLGRAHAAVLVEIEALEWRTRLAVRDSWTRWSALAAETETTTRLLDAMDDLLTIVEALQNAGEFSRVEARLFHLARLQAEIERTDLRAARDAARIQLLGLIGLPPDAPVRLQPITFDRAAPATTTDLDLDLDLRAAPDIRIALAAYDLAESTLEQEIREQYPDLGVMPGYGTRDGVRQFSIGLSLPIPILNANRQAIETAIAGRDAARVRVELALERTTIALAAARITHRRASQRLTLVENDLVPLVADQFEETRRLARLGQVDTLILLDGLERQRLATLQRIRARRDLIVASNAIDALLGPPPADEPTAPITPPAEVAP